MTKCLNTKCNCGEICVRFDPKAGYREPVICPDGGLECTKMIIKDDDEASA